MLFPIGYQFLGTIGASTTHTTDVPSQKTLQRGETLLKLLATSQSATRLELLVSTRVQTLWDTTPLKPLASPRVQTLWDTTALKPLVSPHGTTLLKPSAWSWVLTSYYFGRIFLTIRIIHGLHH